LAITLELPRLSKLANALRLVLLTDGLQPIPGHNQHHLHLQPARQVARVSLFIHMQNGDETLNPKTLNVNPKPGVFIHTPNEIQTASHHSYLGVTCYFFCLILKYFSSNCVFIMFGNDAITWEHTQEIITKLVLNTSIFRFSKLLMSQTLTSYRWFLDITPSQYWINPSLDFKVLNVTISISYYWFVKFV
jgi:hypothetical protein